MKNKRYIFIYLICVCLAVFLFKKLFIKIDNIQINNSMLDANIIYKGLNGAVDFICDEEENFYIAYKDKIQFINKNGKSYNIIKNKDLNITSIEYKNKKIYIASKTFVYCYDINDNNFEKIIKNIPNYGDYKDSHLLMVGDNLYVTIGTVTNSGVVGNDNEWLKVFPYAHDVSPENVMVKGFNYGTYKTGAFVPYKTKNFKGEIIPKKSLGNGSIVAYNIKEKTYKTFAWGIRNIKGIDFDSKNRIIASVGGMENRGFRAIKGDVDYIYKIKKSVWYGWPDYSGGDPITSPRFKDKNNAKVNFILAKHPSSSPPAPLYQHKSVNAVKNIAIDRKGIFGEKDSTFFYDVDENAVFKISNKGLKNEFFKFYDDFRMCCFKFHKDNLLVLDKNSGYLFSVNKK